jgi:hypothetical protein
VAKTPVFDSRKLSPLGQNAWPTHRPRQPPKTLTFGSTSENVQSFQVLTFNLLALGAIQPGPEKPHLNRTAAPNRRNQERNNQVLKNLTLRCSATSNSPSLFNSRRAFRGSDRKLAPENAHQSPSEGEKSLLKRLTFTSDQPNVRDLARLRNKHPEYPHPSGLFTTIGQPGRAPAPSKSGRDLP